MITEFNEKGHPMVFSDEAVNTEQLKEKCIKAIESLSGVHGAAERKAEACFKIALSELENNWKQRAEAAEAIVSDVNQVIALLSEREWAEHCTQSETGKRLEELITELHDDAAPAVSLAELVPDEMPTSYIYHGGNGAFNAGKEAGWNACRAAILRNIEEEK